MNQYLVEAVGVNLFMFELEDMDRNKRYKNWLDRYENDELFKNRVDSIVNDAASETSLRVDKMRGERDLYMSCLESSESLAMRRCKELNAFSDMSLLQRIRFVTGGWISVLKNQKHG